MTDTETRVDLLEQELARSNQSADMLSESLAELELALEDAGWVRLGLWSQYEFSRAGIEQMVRYSRLMYLKNPLIRRGVNVKTFYVWGQGYEISARDQNVKDAINLFLEDEGNEQCLFSRTAAMMRDQDLQTDGNVFFALFPNRVTGHVKVRTIPIEEITEIFTNPDDRNEPWFYRRVWSQETITSDGARSNTERDEWYPDWRYRPTRGTGAGVSWRTSPREAQSVRPTNIAGKVINWQTPIMHVKVGHTSQMRFGVPEVYPALDWAKAHTKFLEDGATIMRSLSAFAWKLSAPKKTRTDAKQRMATTLGTGGLNGETNPPPIAGAIQMLPEGTEGMVPINKSGATIGLDDGRHFRLQVASAMGLPDTFLSGDIDVGNHATAATMDRPTELMMLARQELWREVLLDLCGFAVEWNVRSVAGQLTGTVLRDQTGNDVVSIDGVADDAIDVNFPPILEHDVQAVLAALVNLATLGGHPWADILDFQTWITEIASALNVENSEEFIAASQAVFDKMQADKQAQAEQMAQLGQKLGAQKTGIPADDGGTDSSSTNANSQSVSNTSSSQDTNISADSGPA